MALAQSARPIPGAVATLGVSDRVTFLRKTYAHLGIALVAFAALTGGMLRFATDLSFRMSDWAVGHRFTQNVPDSRGNWQWAAVLILFMIVGWVAERLARSDSGKGLQYLGLFIAVTAEAMLLQPMIWILMILFNSNPDAILTTDGHAHAALTGQAASILMQAIVITLTIFVGLSLFVVISKKDFSFLKGTLAILSFAALGIIFASLGFGFSLGAVFSGAIILLMAGYILYQTSLVLNYFNPNGYVAAALMLFSTIATLFWYVLRLLMELNRR